MRLFTCVLLLISLGAASPPARGSALGVPGCNGQVNALLAHDGVLYAGGMFTLAGGQPAGGIAAWDGTRWTALGSGVSGTRVYWDMYRETFEIPPQVHCLAVYDGQLVAGGSFTHVDGVAAASVASWDGQQWRPLGGGMPNPVIFRLMGGESHRIPPAVHSLAVWGGELYAGGIFSSAGDSAASAIARWDGSTWKRVGYGIFGNLPPRVLALVPDGGRLLVGGEFQVAGFQIANCLAAWDGSVWGQVAPLGPNGAVRAILVREGELVVGGEFTMAGDVPASRLARLEGGIWSPVGGGPPNPVHALMEFGGWLHVGAWVQDAGRWVNRLQTDGPVRALVPWQGGMAFGGRFHTVGPQVGWNVEQWPQGTTGVPAPELPAAARLVGVWPNPLNPGATLTFSLPRPGHASLTVLDARGRSVAVLLERSLEAGEHEVTWNGRGEAGRMLPSGVYLAVLRTSDGTAARKLTLVR